MSARLDEIDRRIIHALMTDARRTSAPDIAAEVDVSPGTIRNRISRLEDEEIITGYRATVDFERADGRLRNLYLCNAPVADREKTAAKVRAIPGVINVRELMTGRRNLHVLAIGEDTADLRRITRSISTLGIEIEDENLLQTETNSPYTPYGPAEGERQPISDFVSLSSGSEVAEMTVKKSAPIAGLSLESASKRGIIGPEALVIAIERENEVRTAHGDTTIRPGDVVTVFSRGGVGDTTLAAFRGDNDPATHE